MLREVARAGGEPRTSGPKGTVHTFSVNHRGATVSTGEVDRGDAKVDGGVRLPGSAPRSATCAVWPCTSHFTSLGLGFPLCPAGMTKSCLILLSGRLNDLITHTTGTEQH